MSTNQELIAKTEAELACYKAGLTINYEPWHAVVSQRYGEGNVLVSWETTVGSPIAEGLREALPFFQKLQIQGVGGLSSRHGEANTESESSGAAPASSGDNKDQKQ